MNWNELGKVDMVWAFFPGNEMKSPKLFIVGRMEVLFGGLEGGLANQIRFSARATV